MFELRPLRLVELPIGKMLIRADILFFSWLFLQPAGEGVWGRGVLSFKSFSVKNISAGPRLHDLPWLRVRGHHDGRGRRAHRPGPRQLLDHLVRDARAAVQDQRNVVGGVVDLVQRDKVQALPVGGVLAMDVADAGSQEVDAQSGDLGALSGVSDLAHADDAVLLAADGADLGLNGQTVVKEVKKNANI